MDQGFCGPLLTSPSLQCKAYGASETAKLRRTQTVYKKMGPPVTARPGRRMSTQSTSSGSADHSTRGSDGSSTPLGVSSVQRRMMLIEEKAEVLR